MDRSRRPRRPLRRLAERRTGRMLRRLAPARARHLDGDQPAALVHRARRLAERRQLGRRRAVRVGSALFARARRAASLRRRPVPADARLHAAAAVSRSILWAPCAGARMRYRAVPHGAVRLALRAARGLGTRDLRSGEGPSVRAAGDHGARARWSRSARASSCAVSSTATRRTARRASPASCAPKSTTSKPRRRAISAAIDWVDADHAGDVLWSARGQLFPACRAGAAAA